jgi:hypothetical protein
VPIRSLRRQVAPTMITAATNSPRAMRFGTGTVGQGRV